MHLLPDQDRVGVSSQNAFPQLEWVEEPPAPFRTADGALYPLRALASVSRRTPAQQEQENRDRTAERKKWDLGILMQAALLSVTTAELQLDASQRKYVLHHYRNCAPFVKVGPPGSRLEAEFEKFSPRTRDGLARAGIPNIDHLVARLCEYFRTPRGCTLVDLGILLHPWAWKRHAPHAYIYELPDGNDFEARWTTIVQFFNGGNSDWRDRGWDREELRSMLKQQEVKHPANGLSWRALGLARDV